MRLDEELKRDIKAYIIQSEDTISIDSKKAGAFLCLKFRRRMA